MWAQHQQHCSLTEPVLDLKEGPGTGNLLLWPVWGWISPAIYTKTNNSYFGADRAPVTAFEVILQTEGQTCQKVNICAGTELHSSPAVAPWSLCLTNQRLALWGPHILQSSLVLFFHSKLCCSLYFRNVLHAFLADSSLLLCDVI